MGSGMQVWGQGQGYGAIYGAIHRAIYGVAYRAIYGAHLVVGQARGSEKATKGSTEEPRPHRTPWVPPISSPIGPAMRPSIGLPIGPCMGPLVGLTSL